jgi:hypothetical protein
VIAVEFLNSSSELVFTTCDFNDEIEHADGERDGTTATSEEAGVPSSLDEPVDLPSSSVIVTQDFDLVKNILSEIFDKSDEENLDRDRIEEKQAEQSDGEQQDEPLVSLVTTNNDDDDDDDFRCLDEMLASIDMSDDALQQLTNGQIDRVDSLLRQIVDAQNTPPSALVDTNDSLLPEACAPLPANASSSCPTSTLIESVPVDDELVRVEQQWARLTDDEKRLGSVAPDWVSDDQAPVCMKCATKFSLTRRRHHCRACGKVFCATCCSLKVKLIHDDNREDRACNDCVQTINQGSLFAIERTLFDLCTFVLVEYLWTYMRNNQKPRSSVLRKKTGR